MTTLTIDHLLRENEELRRRLEEAEEALRAIHHGEVDAVVVEAEREKVYTFESPEAFYRSSVARALHPAAALTAEGAVIACNRRFADLLESSPEFLAGRPLQDFVAPDSDAALKNLLGEGLAGEVEDTVTLLRSTLPPVTVHLGASPLCEGALGECLMITDLTEQRHYEELLRTQEELRQSREQLASDLAAAQRLQEISTRLIQEEDGGQFYEQILDAVMAIMRSDFATMQMWDPSSESLRLLAYRGFSEEFAADFQILDIDTSTTCGAACRGGHRVIAPQLKTFEGIAGTPSCQAHLEAGVQAAQSTPLLSRSGELLGMISTHWRVPYEPPQRDLNLLDVLARQAADLIERRRAEQALREADRRKDEFLATLAHELRNPLAPIRNAVQILQAKGPPAPELQYARGVISRQSELMARLLEDLLDVSRIARKKLELRTETVDLARVVEAALETSRPLIEAGGHELSLNLPPVPILLNVDPLRLAQVFANLLANAAKYTDKGGRIEISAQRQGSEVLVSVKDNGIGIAPETLPQIFAIFSQEKLAVERSQGGLGIGLSLVKGLVELHGGSIEAMSDGPGAGSEFVVRLPIAANPCLEQGPSGEEGAAPTVLKRRILVVDDSRDSADSLAMLLQILGHEVSTAYDGEQAAEAAGASRPDLVLLDLGMPKLDGYEVCRRLRAQTWSDEMFLIALTGWGQEEDRLRTEEAGFDFHVVKPIDFPALMKLLAALPAKRSVE